MTDERRPPKWEKRDFTDYYWESESRANNARHRAMATNPPITHASEIASNYAAAWHALKRELDDLVVPENASAALSLGRWREKCNALAYEQIASWDALYLEQDERRRQLEADRRAIEREKAQEQERIREERRRNRPVPAPPALPYGASHRGAELLVADWMHHLGMRSASVTRYAQDGGIDVESVRYAAQVKHQAGPAGGPEVQKLFGAATAREKLAVFFTSAGYTAAAKTFADSVALPLLIFSPEAGTLTAANPSGETLLEGVEEDAT